MKNKYIIIENESWPYPGWEKWADFISRLELEKSNSAEDQIFLVDIIKSYEKIIRLSTGPRNKLIKKIRRSINVEKRARERELEQKINSESDWLQTQIKKLYG